MIGQRTLEQHEISGFGEGPQPFGGFPHGREPVQSPQPSVLQAPCALRSRIPDDDDLIGRLKGRRRRVSVDASRGLGAIGKCADHDDLAVCFGLGHEFQRGSEGPYGRLAVIAYDRDAAPGRVHAEASEHRLAGRDPGRRILCVCADRDRRGEGRQHTDGVVFPEQARIDPRRAAAMPDLAR